MGCAALSSTDGKVCNCACVPLLGYKLVETRSTRKVVHTHTVKKCDDCRYIYHKPRSDFVQPSHNTDEETEAQIN